MPAAATSQLRMAAGQEQKWILETLEHCWMACPNVVTRSAAIRRPPARPELTPPHRPLVNNIAYLARYAILLTNCFRRTQRAIWHS